MQRTAVSKAVEIPTTSVCCQTGTDLKTAVVQPTNTEQGHKPSMVVEPMPCYQLPVNLPRFPSRHAGI